MTHATRHEWTLWVVAVSCALHAAEEYLTGWQAWAVDALGIVMPTAVFLVANSVLVALAASAARVGWRAPAATLVIPAATLVNGVFLHILPTVLQGRVSPGVYTSMFLYVPFSCWALVGALHDGVPKKAVVSASLGGTLMMLAVVMGARALSLAAPGAR